MKAISSTHALYIHWPYCLKKCPYCDFNSHVRDSIDEQAWHDALLADLQVTAQKAEKRPVSSIFFGGGTPSLMPPFIVESLLNEAHKLLGFTNDIEITLEANPTSTEMKKLHDLKLAGVNRISLGVQSLASDQLKFLGREHSATEALAALDLVRQHFSRYSFDLIYALPDQSLQQWEAQLAEALPHVGEHLSLYQLTIEQGTQFYHHHKSGKLVMPEDAMLAEFYQLTQLLMEAAGLPAYEISNHAQQGGEAKHNVHIWRGGSYLGIGPGAHGRLETKSGKRYATTQTRSPEAYLKSAIDRYDLLDSEERLEERILMGLRLAEGLQLPVHHWPATYLEALKEEGLITFTQSHIIPTLQGKLLLNSLTSGLVEQYLHST